MRDTYRGLQRVPTFDELVQRVNDPIFKKYPDRRATFMENSPYLSNLRGEGFMEALNMQQSSQIKEQQRQLMIRNYAMQSNMSRLELSSLAASFRTPSSGPSSDGGGGPGGGGGSFASYGSEGMQTGMGEAEDDINEELQHQRELEKARRQENIEMFRRRLQQAGDLTFGAGATVLRGALAANDATVAAIDRGLRGTASGIASGVSGVGGLMAEGARNIYYMNEDAAAGIQEFLASDLVSDLARDLRASTTPGQQLVPGTRIPQSPMFQPHPREGGSSSSSSGSGLIPMEVAPLAIGGPVRLPEGVKPAAEEP